MDNLSAFEIPWPQPGDDPFAEGKNWLASARLHFSSDQWDMYATGYKEAADRLVADVLREGMWLDMVVYPISFLYRHYLELRLKNIIILGADLIDVAPDWKKGHDLKQLWPVAQKILRKVWPAADKQPLRDVEAVLRQFGEHDPGSFSFRYPVANTGGRTLAGLRRIDLKNLKEVMARVGSLLDGSSNGITEYLQEKRAQGLGS